MGGGSNIHPPLKRRLLGHHPQDRTFAVWDLGDKSLLFQSSIVSSSPFNCIAATARRRGGTLAVASQDGRVRVYSWHEGGQQGGSSEQGNATSFKIAEHASIVDAVAGFKQQAAERRRASRGRTQASMSSLTISAPNQAGLASGLGNAIKVPSSAMPWMCFCGLCPQRARVFPGIQ